MTLQVLEIEGTWEEILAQAAKFAGRRVRITLLADEEEEEALSSNGDEEALPSPQESFRQGWLEIKTGKTRLVSELWEDEEKESKILAAIAREIEKIESLPEILQQQVAEYLQEYIAGLKDGLQAQSPQVTVAKQEIVFGDETLKSAEECFRQGWREAMTGQTIPLSELWEGIDGE